MKKSKLVSYFHSGFNSVIKTSTLKELESEITLFEVENENKELITFANELNSNFPQIKILHDYYLRIKLSRIESYLKTIKNVIVFILIISIIAGIVLAMG